MKYIASPLSKKNKFLVLDLELVKTVQPNSLIVFAKKLPLKPQPKIKNFFLLFIELAESFIRRYGSTYVLISDEDSF